LFGEETDEFNDENRAKRKIFSLIDKIERKRWKNFLIFADHRKEGNLTEN